MWLVAVTAKLFTDLEACPAATVELPQEENPARPFTAKPRPAPVCSAKIPMPPSALAAPWTPFPPPVLPSMPTPLPVGLGRWPVLALILALQPRTAGPRPKLKPNTPALPAELVTPQTPSPRLSSGPPPLPSTPTLPSSPRRHSHHLP